MKRFGKVLVAMTAAAGLIGIGSAASAQTEQTIEHTGQGTNEDGTCTAPVFNPEVPEGRQIWQFNLTPGQSPEDPSMSAEFDDNTQVTDQAPDDELPGGTFFWHIETAAGAALESASVTFTGNDPPPPSQFVVSHCEVGDMDLIDDNDDDEIDDDDEEDDDVDDAVEAEPAPAVAVEPTFTG